MAIRFVYMRRQVVVARMLLEAADATLTGFVIFSHTGVFEYANKLNNRTKENSIFLILEFIFIKIFLGFFKLNVRTLHFYLCSRSSLFIINRERNFSSYLDIYLISKGLFNTSFKLYIVPLFFIFVLINEKFKLSKRASYSI